MSGIFTPDTLAERWGCSGKKVRLLILSGELRAFRLGERLIRIPADAVEEFECRTIALPSTEEPGPSASGKTDDARVALRLERQTARKRNAASTHSGATTRSRRTSPGGVGGSKPSASTNLPATFGPVKNVPLGSDEPMGMHSMPRQVLRSPPSASYRGRAS